MSSNEVTLGGDVLSTLVATLQSVQAELSRLTAANTEMSERLARLTEKVEPAKVETKSQRRSRLEMQAIRELIVCGPSVKVIARKLGVPATTLAGWSLFRKAMERQIAANKAARTVLDDYRDADFEGTE